MYSWSHKESENVLHARFKQMSLVTCHLSLVTCHLSLVTCHLSLVTCPLSFVTYHLSLVTCHLHLSLVTCCRPDILLESQNNPKMYYLLGKTCHLSLVICHLLPVTWSLVTCYLSLVLDPDVTPGVTKNLKMYDMLGKKLVTCYLSLVTCHLLLVTCYLSLVTCHLLLVTCYLSQVVDSGELLDKQGIWKCMTWWVKNLSLVTCHLLLVTCYLVTCYLSLVRL